MKRRGSLRNVLVQRSQQCRNLTFTGRELSLRLARVQHGLCRRFLTFSAAMLSSANPLLSAPLATCVLTEGALGGKIKQYH